MNDLHKKDPVHPRSCLVKPQCDPTHVADDDIRPPAGSVQPFTFQPGGREMNLVPDGGLVSSDALSWQPGANGCGMRAAYYQLIAASPRESRCAILEELWIDATMMKSGSGETFGAGNAPTQEAVGLEHRSGSSRHHIRVMSAAETLGSVCRNARISHDKMIHADYSRRGSLARIRSSPLVTWRDSALFLRVRNVRYMKPEIRQCVRRCHGRRL